MQWSQEPKAFCSNLIAFLESTLNFEHFEKNKPNSLNISEIFDFERRGYSNA